MPVEPSTHAVTEAPRPAAGPDGTLVYGNQSNVDSDGDGHSLGLPWFDHRQRRQARWAKSNALPRHASLFIMVFRVHVLSRVDRSMSLSRLKEPLPVPLSYALERGQTFETFWRNIK